ncbi:MAG: NAD(P)/FAD-dependent oxidoreductase [Gammaproteobacteria bacterium]|nr:NAD(P)/FAD-dependent oxidoreductase [Gammaproteobacteria bacterium]
MAERCEAVVIGAGVVGLAVGRELARAGREVLVLERHELIGSEISSRNSEVIHAGIYYPTGSIKAQTCVRGKALLYKHCEAYKVPHERLGKIIVATARGQLETLEAYQRQALANGVGELPWMTQADILGLEPEVEAVAGLYSESTGIVDSHAFMLSLLGDVEAAGGAIAYLTEVTDLLQAANGVRVRCGDFDLDADVVVNAAGLEAPAMAARLGGAHAGYYAKGHYYTLSGGSPFRRLVYPVAEPGGLGVHVTLDLAGQARFGPDVVWQDDEDYGFDGGHFNAFVEAIRRYYPGLDASRLNPGYTGIRPKLAPRGEPASDFVIEGPADHGVPGLVNLLGIESPGLTASLAIAERVAQMPVG